MSVQSKYLFDFDYYLNEFEEEEVYSAFFKMALKYVHEWDSEIVLNDLKDVLSVARQHHLTKINGESPTKVWASGLEDEVNDSSILGLASRVNILLALDTPFSQLSDDVSFLKEIINAGRK